MPRPSDPRPESGFRISGIGLRISPSPLSNYHPASGERVGLRGPQSFRMELFPTVIGVRAQRRSARTR